MTMSGTAHIHVKLDREKKELFLKLCEEEGVDVSQAIRDLIYEAIARGYIIKERKERYQKVAQGGSA
jgi:antitoxin component of RelBE/YafQ-DinJ toxin-antitoxin module